MFPLRLTAWVGLAVSGSSLLYLMAKVGGLVTTDPPTVLAAALMFLGGVQMMFLGIVGEYVGRIYDQIRLRPSWIVWESIGMPPAASDQST
jgi:dolichol-phosphate mannosyltransferase